MDTVKFYGLFPNHAPPARRTDCDMFDYHSESHKHNTWNRKEPKIPKICVELVKRSLIFKDPYQRVGAWMGVNRIANKGQMLLNNELEPNFLAINE